MSELHEDWFLYHIQYHYTQPGKYSKYRINHDCTGVNQQYVHFWISYFYFLKKETFDIDESQ